MGGGIPSLNKTPKGISKPEGKIFTPVAYSPINKATSLQNSETKSKVPFPKPSPRGKVDDVAYHPGMLKVSPNSGFSQFKKPSQMIGEESKTATNGGSSSQDNQN